MLFFCWLKLIYDFCTWCEHCCAWQYHISYKIQEISMFRFDHSNIWIKKYLNKFFLQSWHQGPLNWTNLLLRVFCNATIFNDEIMRSGRVSCGLYHIITQSSLINCTAYKHLRDGLNVLHSDSDLVKYYQLVIEERRKEEREWE